MVREILTDFLRPDGPYLYVRLVTASYALSAVGRLLPVKIKQVPGYRRKVPATIWYGGTVVVALALATCIYGVSRNEQPARVAAAPVQFQPVRSGLHLGVFEMGETESYHPVEHFAAAVGRSPDIVLYYSGWREPFLTSFAETAYRHGAEPLIQIEPDHIGIHQIADGYFDSYLRAYAAQVREYRHPVILSFAPEPNGPWYSWGWTRTAPATWVAAWRHVVRVFRAQHATNVTWLWTVNRKFTGSGPLRAYWPGSSYVNWVGIDAYYEYRDDTFSSVFGPTLAAVRAITGKPVLLSETAVGPVSGQVRCIPGLFAGIRRHRLLGLVWFDLAQHRGIHHQDWRLEHAPAGLAVFRREVSGFGRPR